MTKLPAAVPPGFIVSDRTAFGTHIGPFFERWNSAAEGPESYTLAVNVEARHGGAPDRAHGGFVLAIVDQAMGIAAQGAMGSLVYTISLSTDFIGPAPVGELLEVTAHATAKTSSHVFMSGHAHCGGRPVASAKGVWVRARKSASA